MMLEDSDLRLVIDRLEDIPDQIAASYLADASSSIWIASGLAKISALYGVSMMQKVAGVPARFISPLEYVLNLRVKCLPVLISLRGSHEDAVEVAESIVGRKSERAIILTGDPLGRAACVLSQGLEVGEKNQVALATGPLPDRDKRFVNFKSILMLSAVTNRLVYSALGNESECDLDCNEIGYAWERAKEGACRLAEQICSVEMYESKQLLILTDGMVSELAYSWQSILSEAGITNPVCLDIKDYTHGDHLVASRTKNTMFLVISHKMNRDVCRVFTERFSSIFPVFSIELKGEQKYHFWENIFLVGNTVAALTRSLGYYNKRPPKDPVIWSWRGWGSMSNK